MAVSEVMRLDDSELVEPVDESITTIEVFRLPVSEALNAPGFDVSFI
jgi:hypothetical protein